MKTSQDIFHATAYAEPSAGFAERVFLAIEEADRLARQRRLMWSKLGLAISSVAFVAASVLYGQEFLASSFWSMISLVFSDAQVVAMYWSEFSLSLLEMFPVQAVMSLLVPSFMLLLFLNMYFSTTEERSFQHGQAHFA